jgi:threonyl-tRNA synthetase
VQRAGQIGAVKLLESSGVYFKGDEAIEKLQRIYGTAFTSKKELEAYEKSFEEARARDHRRLGVELDLFSFSPLAPASPFFHPKGAVVYNGLIGYVRELNARNGYGEVITPQILDVELWHTSGHYANYRENMFFTELDERQFAVKPMNCPTHCLIYRTRKRSYRDLPLRYADFGRLHRYERSGVTSGLTRVRSFAQDDAHIFCTEEQLEAEVALCARLILSIYREFGFARLKITLGTRPEKRWHRRQWEWPRRARGGAGLPGRVQHQRGTAPSTARRSTSRSRTRSAAGGSSARSSSTASCPRASSSSTSAPTAPFTRR